MDGLTRYSGVASQRIGAYNPSNDMVWTITDYSAVTSGLRYRIEVWCRTSSGLSGKAKLIGNWFNNDMVSKGSFEGSPQLVSNSNWVLLVARGVCPPMPETNNRGRLQVELRAEITAGCVWFDQAWCGLDNQEEDPLPSITHLTVTPQTLSTRFNWANSSGAECTGTKIVYRTDRYPLTDSDGTLLADVPGEPGTASMYVHQNQTFGQRYYYGFFAHSEGGASLSRPQFATAVGSDFTKPTTPVITDEGDYTWSSDTLSASWTSTDPESGIAGYRYAVGTTRGGTDVVGWTDIGTVTSITKSGLNLKPGTKYWFTVKSQNGAGLWSSQGYSDGITAVKNCTTIAEAKAIADGIPVRLSGIVSAAGVFGDGAYLQQSDRSAGIKLEGSVSSLIEGQTVTVIGTLSTANGERKLVNVVVQ